MGSSGLPEISSPAGPEAPRAGDAADAGLELEPLQRELLVEEAAGLRDGLRDSLARERYEALAAAAGEGAVPGHLVGALEDLLELGLETGRLRRRYTAEGEQALLRLYQRTSRGAAIQRATAEANAALEPLRGQELEAISFSARAPGSFGLTLQAARCRITLRIQRHGVWVESVEVEA